MGGRLSKLLIQQGGNTLFEYEANTRWRRCSFTTPTTFRLKSHAAFSGFPTDGTHFRVLHPIFLYFLALLLRKNRLWAWLPCQRF